MVQQALEVWETNSTEFKRELNLTKAEEKALYLRSAEAQQDYIKLDGNRLTVQLPITRDDYEQSTKGPDGLEKKAEEVLDERHRSLRMVA